MSTPRRGILPCLSLFLGVEAASRGATSTNVMSVWAAQAAVCDADGEAVESHADVFNSQAGGPEAHAHLPAGAYTTRHRYPPRRRGAGREPRPLVFIILGIFAQRHEKVE